MRKVERHSEDLKCLSPDINPDRIYTFIWNLLKLNQDSLNSELLFLTCNLFDLTCASLDRTFWSDWDLIGSYLEPVFLDFGLVGLDTGLVGLDTGLIGRDTGLIGLDTGPVGLDTGRVGLDTGLVGLDTGRVGLDTGLIGLDRTCWS